MTSNERVLLTLQDAPGSQVSYLVKQRARERPWEALLPSATFFSGLTRNPLSTGQSSSQSCATRVLHQPPIHCRRTKSRMNITTESCSLIDQNGTPFSTRFNHEQLEPDDDLLLVTDLFCGAGGTSTGILKAGFLLRRNMQLLAINHWPSAIATHSLNHPHVRHLCESLDSIDPRKQVKNFIYWPRRRNARITPLPGVENHAATSRVRLPGTYSDGRRRCRQRTS